MDSDERQRKTAKIRQLAEDLRADEDKDFLLSIADEYEKMVQDKKPS